MKQRQLDALTQRLLDSYEAQATRPDQGEPLPSFEAIIEVLNSLKRLLFPGFYADEPLPRAGRRYRVGHWISELHRQLTHVLTLALSHERALQGVTLNEHCDELESLTESIIADQTPIPSHYKSRRLERKRRISALINSQDLCEQATRLSTQLLEQLPDLRYALDLDAHAALEGDPAAGNLEEVILTYPGFEAILTHRFAHLLYREGIPYLPRALSEHAHSRTGIDLHPGASIGASFFIDHGTGVVIGETTEIGDRVKIYQGVTLGALSVKRELSGLKRHPTIEDEVVIYAGATVLGGDTVIGEGSMIGGNVWIVNSVPSGSTVIRTPPTLEVK